MEIMGGMGIKFQDQKLIRVYTNFEVFYFYKCLRFLKTPIISIPIALSGIWFSVFNWSIVLERENLNVKYWEKYRQIFVLKSQSSISKFENKI